MSGEQKREKGRGQRPHASSFPTIHPDPQHPPLSTQHPHSYNARAAQDDLEARLGPYLTSAPLLSPRLLLNLSTRWPAYDAERRRYVGFEAGEGEGEQKGEQSGAAGTAQAAAA